VRTLDVLEDVRKTTNDAAAAPSTVRDLDGEHPHARAHVVELAALGARDRGCDFCNDGRADLIGILAFGDREEEPVARQCGRDAGDEYRGAMQIDDGGALRALVGGVEPPRAG
jgi:hypothetical protein